MNVIFISPHFPEHFYNFCDRLKNLGVNVLGIGDCPYDGIGDNCRNSLTEYYYVSSLENYDEVFRAVAFFSFKYGKIDFIDSQNEYWLELEARLRTDFNITTGFKTEDMEKVKYKSKMKAGYEAANVKTARYYLVDTFEGCEAFIARVGYPVVVKPDNGVGASDTWKLNSDDEFWRFWETKAEKQYIGENVLSVLRSDGVDHIELRMFDLNPLASCGVEIKDVVFAQLFLTWLAAAPRQSVSVKDQVQAVQNFKNAAHYDLKTVKIAAPDGRVSSVADAALDVLGRMREFYRDFPEEVQEVIHFETKKFLDGENRYAWKIRKEFSENYVEKGLELAKKRQEEIDV